MNKEKNVIKLALISRSSHSSFSLSILYAQIRKNKRSNPIHPYRIPVETYIFHVYFGHKYDTQQKPLYNSSFHWKKNRIPFGSEHPFTWI